MPRYFDGQPCRNGHVAEKTVAGSRCCECTRLNRIIHKEANRKLTAEWYVNNAGKAREYAAKWRSRQDPKKLADASRRSRAKKIDVYVAKEKERARVWREKNHERHLAYSAAWRATNRESENEKSRLRSAALWAAEPEKLKANQVAYRSQKREEIAGRPRPLLCEICHDKTIGRIVFDHCHKNGHFRGWLCNRCNLVLGRVRDDPELLRALAMFLEQGLVPIIGTSSMMGIASNLS